MKHQTKPSRIVFQACNNNNRRRRSLTPFGKETTDSATVSVGPLYVADEGKSQYRPQHCCSEPWWRSWLFHSLSFFSPSNKDRPFSAAYSEYFWLFMKCILMCLRISQQPKTWSLINPPPRALQVAARHQREMAWTWRAWRWGWCSARLLPSCLFWEAGSSWRSFTGWEDYLMPLTDRWTGKLTSNLTLLWFFSDNRTPFTRWP